jgi:GNAT superfamily N-acetyltransferase
MEWNGIALLLAANYRGHSIGMKVMEKSYQVCKSRGYKVYTVNCLGFNSERIAIRLSECMNAISMSSVIDSMEVGR